MPMLIEYALPLPGLMVGIGSGSSADNSKLTHKQVLMNRHSIWNLHFCLAALVLSLSASAQAQSAVRYETQPGSKVKIEGTSSIHDWSAESAAVGGFMELDPAFDADLKTARPGNKVEISIPVRQLKSNWGNAMNKNMWEHLSVTNSPVIKYKLLNLTPKSGASPQFNAEGTLTVAGITRTNTMVVTLERIDTRKIKVTGNASVKMSDFSIPPPTIPILGIKTDENVKVSIDCLFAQPEKTP